MQEKPKKEATAIDTSIETIHLRSRTNRRLSSMCAHIPAAGRGYPGVAVLTINTAPMTNRKFAAFR